METSATLRYGWRDEFLTWRPDMNSGIKQISLPSNEIWKPDFIAYNSVSDMSDMDGYPANVIVQFDGSGYELSSYFYEVACSYNMQLTTLRQLSGFHRQN